MAVILILNTPVFAGVTSVKKGETAAYDGFLVDPDTMRKMQKELTELDGLRKINASLEKSIELRDLSIKTWEEQTSLLKFENTRLHVRLMKADRKGSWERAGWLLVGVIGTGFMFKLTQEVR